MSKKKISLPTTDQDHMASTPKNNIIFAYNPISGEGEITSYLDQIVSIYQKHHYIVTLLRISRDVGYSPLPALVEQLDPEHILIAGGDGTVNRLVNFMQHHGITTPIGIIPSGTANDLATTLGIPTDPIKAVRAIIGGERTKIDLGKVGRRYFVNVLSCGLMADLSQRTPTLLKNTFGKVAYYFSSISELPNFRKMSISVDSDELCFKGTCLLMMIFNGRTAGSLKMVRGASLTDGVLDVLIVRGDNVANTIQTLFHVLLQRKGSYPDDVLYFQTRSLHVSLDGEQVATDIDGEPGGNFPLSIECVPLGLNIIIPKSNSTK